MYKIYVLCKNKICKCKEYKFCAKLRSVSVKNITFVQK